MTGSRIVEAWLVHPLVRPVWEPPPSRLSDEDLCRVGFPVPDGRDAFSRYGVLGEYTGSRVDGPLLCAGHVQPADVLGRFAYAYGRPLGAGVWPVGGGVSALARFEVRAVHRYARFESPAWCVRPHPPGAPCRCDPVQPPAVVLRWFDAPAPATRPVTLATLHPPRQATVPVADGWPPQVETIARSLRPGQRRDYLRHAGWRTTTGLCPSAPDRLPERWYRHGHPGRYTLGNALRTALTDAVGHGDASTDGADR